MKYFFAAIAAALLLVAAGAANAGERIEESGHEAFATIVWDELELDEGHSLAWWRGDGVGFDDDPTSPAHLVTADCAGTYEFMPDETYTVTGFCTYTTRDGDKYYLKWWESPGMEEGRYEYTGGTGKFAGITGGGTYTGEELTDTLSTSQFEGVMELP